MEKSIKTLEEEISRLNREFAILSSISQTVNQSVDLDEILNNSLDKMMEMMEVRSAGIYLLDEKENDLVYVTHRGFSQVFSKGMKRFKMGENITGRTALSGEPIFIEDYPNHPEALSTGNRRRGQIAGRHSPQIGDEGLRDTQHCAKGVPPVRSP